MRYAPPIDIFPTYIEPVNMFTEYLNTIPLEVIKSAKSTIYRQRCGINGKDDES